MKKLSLAVVGSRSFRDAAVMRAWIKVCMPDELPSNVEIVSGGARGTDALARKYAEDEGITYKEFPAEWEHYGKSAGTIRNQEIIEHAEVVLAFWDGNSAGTKDTINKAIRAKKPVIIVPFGAKHARTLFD